MVDINDMRVIITQQSVLSGIPAWIPISIARVESDLNPRCIGDGGTSFGLFQLHRGGLAPDSLSDEELMNPSVNANIALQGMTLAYQNGTAQNLIGIELLKYVAFNSGWPGKLGVAYFEEHRPDYVSRLSKMYLEEVGEISSNPPRTTGDLISPVDTPAPQHQQQPAAPAEPTGGAAIKAPAGSFTAFTSWYISPGDTMSQISLHMHIPLDVIARFNGIDNPDVIQAGDVLMIPRVYRVRPGDTLSQICEAEGAGDYHFVAYVNKQLNPDLLNVGDVLYL